MRINHVIIFSDRQGQEADELVQGGLTEGSNRVHPGQGTRNRKFYFSNFFLEIAWIIDAREIRSPLTAPTKLWQRANHRQNGCSPFGLCLDSSEELHDLFKNALEYRPTYLPTGQSFDILTNEQSEYLPWTCRLPSSDPGALALEPTNHKLGIKILTKVKFGIPKKDYQNIYTNFFKDESRIDFVYDTQYTLTLEFDGGKEGQKKLFNSIPLTIAY
ncbi:MAG: hypothetical protein HKN76_14915 [Saprospiraceae bacterium]|nr:hypothetical protein [Saprospiraceae bacterium]